MPRLSVDQYHDLIRAGALGPDDRVELLNGLLVQKKTKTPRRNVAAGLIVETLGAAVPKGFCVKSAGAVTLSDSEPEPDVAVAVGNFRRYTNHHPGGAETLLVVEVSDSDPDQNRKIKKAIYAEAGIPCYWIIDVTSRKVEVYTRPVDSNYLSCEEFTHQVPLCIGDQPAVMIEVASLLP